MNKFEPSIEIEIDEKKIGNNSPVYFIAEIGSNFDCDLERAKDLIYMAKEAGANAAKFQHYTADSLVSDYGFKKIVNNKSHQSHWDKSVYDTYEQASINQDWTGILQETCKDANLSFLTSPYSIDLVDYVDPFVPAYKVGSGDITWLEIIEHIASKGKPIFLATGASELIDVKRAVDVILSITSNLILLQCNTNYTSSRNNFVHLQLNVITEYQKLYPGVITGLSDHTQGCVSVLGAVALGAKVIEKHFTDSTNRVGPDHSFSMTPVTWLEMVERTRELEDALGDGYKKVEENEIETAILQRRSICSVKKLNLGDKIQKHDLEVLRPCPKNGIDPSDMISVIGKTLNKNIRVGEHLKWSDFD
jgi:N-acetylneuraminate synthase